MRLGIEDEDLGDLLTVARTGIARIAGIPSGRRGDQRPRHPLVKGAGGFPVPEELPAQTATQAAAAVIEWMEVLRKSKSEQHRWVMNKWLYASEKERGRMRLDDDAEESLAKALPVVRGINVAIEYAKLSKARETKHTKKVARMRLTCATTGKFGRDTEGIRWAMTWMCALHFPPPLDAFRPSAEGSSIPVWMRD